VLSFQNVPRVLAVRKFLEKLLKRLLVKALSPGLKRSLRALIRASVIHKQIPSVHKPERGKIAVLAPHMDDEVLGCGGTIARHVQAGADVSVIFLTDGRYGSAANAALTGPERGRRQRELIHIRKLEARRAGDILGIGNIAFLDAEDGRLATDLLAAKRLRTILELERPDIVYLPFFLDTHVDHCAASELLIASVAGTRQDFECRCYEVWTPLFPNMVVAIDTTIELKKRALTCYESQLADMDYFHTGIGLNAYRSSAIGCKAGRFVEAFFSLPLADYRRLQRGMRRFL
jgi:LmbE family N-acetylglucosaminyl deacetylase